MYGNNYGYYNPTRNIGVPVQPMNNQYMQPQNQMPINNYIQQPVQNVQSSLQGKIVDNVDVVKATDIPLDGSVSYFPLTDGSAIVTKKLGMNGISEIQVYKPVLEESKAETPTTTLPYVTINDLDDRLSKFDNSETLSNLLEEIKDLKKEMKEYKDHSKSKER